jgi:hypothetical protein
MPSYLFHGVPLHSDIPLPEVTRSRARGRGVLIQRTETPVSEKIEWFHRWQIPAGPQARQQNTWMSFGRLQDGYLLRLKDLADFEISSAGDRVRCRSVDDLPASTLRHLLLDQILPLALRQSGRLVLHASAVHVPRFGAIAFAGPAGAGKSTLAAALATRGCQLVSDDSLLVSLDRPVVSAVPGYPGVRLWRDSSRSLRLDGDAATAVAHYTRKQRLSGASLPFRRLPSPLRVVVVLGRRRAQSHASRTRRLTSRDALVSLVRSTYLLDVQDRRQLARMFGDLASLAARVPVVRLDVRHAGTSLARAAVEVLDLARRAVDS